MPRVPSAAAAILKQLGFEPVDPLDVGFMKIVIDMRSYPMTFIVTPVDDIYCTIVFVEGEEAWEKDGRSVEILKDKAFASLFQEIGDHIRSKR